MADNRTDKRRLGDIGENIACEFLKRRGFEILDRNYLRKWGELDIVAKKAGIIRFVEVKSVRSANQDVSYVTNRESGSVVTHGTSPAYRPEENMHPGKLKRLMRTMQIYMLEKNLESDFQLDLVTVKIDEKRHLSKVEMIENIIVS